MQENKIYGLQWKNFFPRLRVQRSSDENYSTRYIFHMHLRCNTTFYNVERIAISTANHGLFGTKRTKFGMNL